MSYGCAGRRDSRRQSAIPRIEAALKLAEEGLSKANAYSKAVKTASKAPTKEAKEAEINLAASEVVFYLNKVGRIQLCLSNTRANSGKGTCAMSK